MDVKSQADNTNASLAAHWRSTADDVNPAGPLFTGGEYAEADIANDIKGLTTNRCGTICTWSGRYYCC